MEQSNTGKFLSENVDYLIQQSIPASEEMLGIEVTLLVAAAAGKGINVSIWIAAPDDGIMNFSTFCSKLTSLSRVVGVDEDWETKRELDLATSKPELLSILRVCHAGIDALGNPMINTKKFLSLCKDRVNGYLLQMSKDNSPSQFIKDEFRATDDDITATMARSKNISKHEENKKQRPQSAPCTRKTSQDNSTLYSQAVESSDNTVSDLDTGPETRDVIMPSSTTRIVIPQKQHLVISNKSTLKSFDGFPTIKVSTDELNKLQEELQQKLCILVSKSNLYHIILAQLGFLHDRELSKSPLATAALASRAKKFWLTTSDVQMIFSSVQFQLQRHHITILIGLIEKYKQRAIEMDLDLEMKSKEKEKEKKFQADNKGVPPPTITDTETGKKEEEQSNAYIISANNDPVTKTSHLLSATWLQRYLVYLRHQGRKSHTKSRNKTERSRGEGIPTSSSDGVHSAKKRSVTEVESLEQLKRALAGLPYTLSEITINKLLQSYEILSEEDIQKEIDIRCKLWKIDADGRGDYKHQLRVQVLKEIKAIADPTSEQDKRLIKQTVYNDFTDSELQLFRNKAKISLMDQMVGKLLKSEHNDSELTKSLFWKFIRDKHKNKGTNFGTWLKDYFEKTEDKFIRIQSDIKNRKVAAVAGRRNSKGMTPLTHIVSKIEDVADALTNNDIKMELRRSLSVLRKEETERAMEVFQSTHHTTNATNKRSNKLTKSCHCHVKSQCPHEYLLVTKDKFDKLFINALSSSVTKIPSEAVCVEEVLKEHQNRYKAKDSEEETKTAGSSASSGAGIGAAGSSASKLPPEKRLFLGSEELALQRAKELRNAMRKESKEAMAKWWAAKKKTMDDEEKKKIQKQQELEKEKKLKRQQAKRAFRTWTELRDHDLYLSQSGEMKSVKYSSSTSNSSGTKGKSKRRPAWDDSFVVDLMEI